MSLHHNWHTKNCSTNQRVDEIDKAIKKAREYEKLTNTSINLGISNPCFELWYLLHYVYTTANLKDYDAVKDRIERSTPLKDYKKNKCVYDAIHGNTQEAIKNSDNLKNHHESLGRTLIDTQKNSYVLNVKNIVESNPYTNVSDLVRYIEELNNK